jgi:hypothetical protein
MKSRALGISTLAVEVTNISKHGLWILIGEEELFLPFVEFPWFKDAPLPAIMNVEQPALGSLYWPLLDVDLTLESIRHPKKYPLISKASARPVNPADR